MTPELNKIYCGDCLEIMRSWPDGCVQCCVTSPPYWGLRDYGVVGQLGLEKTPQEYVEKMVEVFRGVRRVLRDDGTLWLNLGDSYNAAGRSGHGTREGCKQGTNRASAECADNCRPSATDLKPKDLIGIPWRVAFALQADGWYLRQDIIWHKPNPMPESVTDRCTKAHEYIFLMSKSERYYFDSDAIAEPCVGQNIHDTTGPGYCAPGQAPNSGNRKALRSNIESRHRSRIPGGQSLQAHPNGKRNKRDVWTVTTKPFKGAHFATFPPALIEPCALAGCPEGGTVLDPFMGAGTVAKVCLRAGRQFLGCELNPKYIAIAQARIDSEMAQGKLF